MKGILLAGGSGTRLYPLTKTLCKQILPVYDKPLIYYPLSTLMMAGIREILIISTPSDTPMIEKLLGSGAELGLKLHYAVQQEPRGIPEAFILGAGFIGSDNVCLILGDNIFYGHDLGGILSGQTIERNSATIFGYYVKDPSRYGVMTMEHDKVIAELEEKPENPKSHWAITGIYLYDHSVIEKAKSLKPSARGELEITDLNRLYLKEGRLKATLLGRGYTWMDAGTQDSLLDASNFVRIIEERQGVKIACLEEIAWRKGFISKEQCLELGHKLSSSGYGQYIVDIAKRENWR